MDVGTVAVFQSANELPHKPVPPLEIPDEGPELPRWNEFNPEIKCCAASAVLLTFPSIDDDEGPKRLSIILESSRRVLFPGIEGLGVSIGALNGARTGTRPRPAEPMSKPRPSGADDVVPLTVVPLGG